jgi:hypothetical protein
MVAVSAQMDPHRFQKTIIEFETQHERMNIREEMIEDALIDAVRTKCMSIYEHE